MARTKQTARKSVGGKSARRALSFNEVQQNSMSRNQHGAFRSRSPAKRIVQLIKLKINEKGRQPSKLEEVII
jgi:hypothetical protein